MATPAPQLPLKVVLVGDSGVGKSSLLLRFAEDVFEELPATVGVDFRVITVRTDRGQRVKVTCWDTAGQERFRTLTASYYRGAHGIILVYSVDTAESFRNVQAAWLEEVRRYSTRSDALVLIVGNKTDTKQRQVTRDEGQRLAREVGALFIETSAKTSDGVARAFELLVSKICASPALVSELDGGGGGIAIAPEAQAASDAASTCSC
ncbi:hypothetical protein CDCA_CDCA08G2340 [Cyanidium caldarium]|uniref:Uncharacterized protein n=1 Tax=Cyanidium caldarium TaxID=2771 RepID=A0AAV9IVH7_CYACA|nr:hypothetical protein CDCA_CDCA08G2340 [Cyanidium caldarium]